MKLNQLLAAGLMLALLGLPSFAFAQADKAKRDEEAQLRARAKDLLKMVLELAGGEQSLPTAKAAAASEPLNLVFLGGKQPVLVRFNILIDGKSVQTYWNDYIEKWYRYLDVNEDGVLDAIEVNLAPNDQSMQQLMRQGTFFPGRGGNLTFGMLGKKDRDKLTLEELQSYYRKLVPAVQVVPQATNDAVYVEAGNTLFKVLDLNKDGKLSKDEFLAAARTLRKLDLDDDEWITLQELTPNYNFNNFQGGRGFTNNRGMPGSDSQINDAFFQVRAGENRLGPVLLERYDRDKVQRLTQKDLGLDLAVFARLDKNGDGGLDREELNSWHDRPADLEFTVRLGKNEGVALEKSRQVFRPAVKETAGVHQMSLEDAQINVLGAASAQGGMMMVRGNQNQFYLQLFRQADTKNKGYIEMTDIEGQQFQFLRQVFASLDRDRDGKLTQKEIQTFVELQSGATDCFVTLSLADHGRAFFQLLDVNRDGRLSQRELLNAWSRVEALDKGKKGFITPADLARQFQINVQRGLNLNFNNGFVVVNGLNSNSPLANPRYPEGTPEWFRKMDRNGDGDVSLAEFLGSREEFERIDTDHDGLISADEAMRFDALARKAK